MGGYSKGHFENVSFSRSITGSEVTYSMSLYSGSLDGVSHSPHLSCEVQDRWWDFNLDPSQDPESSTQAFLAGAELCFEPPPLSITLDVPPLDERIDMSSSSSPVRSTRPVFFASSHSPWTGDLGKGILTACRAPHSCRRVGRVAGNDFLKNPVSLAGSTWVTGCTTAFTAWPNLMAGLLEILEPPFAPG